ncbi:hypothetical protein TrCOL_g7240 [Triparma columacea]|nr:hypothetical protein TrCOL_g7240 [Triparma columacea]
MWARILLGTLLLFLLPGPGTSDVPPETPQFAISPSILHSSQSISVSIEVNAINVPVTYTFEPSSTQSNDAYTAAGEFCASHDIFEPSCRDSVAFKLLEEGAPVLTSNFLLESDLSRLLSFAGYIHANSRPRMSASLLESCMTAMGLLPIQLAGPAPTVSAQTAYNLLAASYYECDLTADAGSIYEYLLKLNEEADSTSVNAELLMNYAVNMLAQGDYRKSRELFDAALEATRLLEHEPNLLLMADIFLERSNLAIEDPVEADGDALDYIQRAVFILTSLEKKLPKNVEGSIEAGEIRRRLAEAYLSMGKIQLSRRQNSHAIRSLRHTLKYSSNNVEAISTMSHAEDAPSYSESVPPITKPTSFMKAGDPIEFVTFASDPSKCELERLLTSARRFGVSFTVLGQGFPTAQWKNGLKLELLLEFLEGLPEEKLVVVVDGYDVVLSGGSEDFIDRYNTILTLNPSNNLKPVVFQADYTFYCPLTNSSLSASVARSYPASPTQYKYLSSGGIAASSSSLASLVRDTLSKYDTETWEKKSDQSLFIRYLVDSQGDADAIPIIVDHYQVMFGGNGGRFRQDFEVDGNGKLRHKKTGTSPVSLHTPGRRKYQEEMRTLKYEGWDADVIQC